MRTNGMVKKIGKHSNTELFTKPLEAILQNIHKDLEKCVLKTRTRTHSLGKQHKTTQKDN